MGELVEAEAPDLPFVDALRLHESMADLVLRKHFVQAPGALQGGCIALATGDPDYLQFLVAGRRVSQKVGELLQRVLSGVQAGAEDADGMELIEMSSRQPE